MEREPSLSNPLTANLIPFLVSCTILPFPRYCVLVNSRVCFLGSHFVLTTTSNFHFSFQGFDQVSKLCKSSTSSCNTSETHFWKGQYTSSKDKAGVIYLFVLSSPFFSSLCWFNALYLLLENFSIHFCSWRIYWFAHPEAIVLAVPPIFESWTNDTMSHNDEKTDDGWNDFLPV